MATGEILSISQLNQTARILLEEGLGCVWVQGEISNFSVPSSGHWYFSLKDSNAQVRCAMFAGKNRGIGFIPKHGDHVLALAQVSLYENRGDFQLLVEKMEPMGEGALQIELEKLTKKLSAEGLFEVKHKKPLPAHPKTVGIVTSATGAALRDILHVLKRRAANISIVIYPTAVQGIQAASQIVEALRIANRRNECDVIILARGGGSLEDLWPFNEEIVARAIFASQIPIVSGIGHEVDFTIADWVADVRAPTPSAAAELVSPNIQIIKDELNKLQHQLLKVIKNKIHFYQHELTFLAKQLKHPQQYWQQISQQLDFQELRLKQLIEKKLDIKRQQLVLSTQLLNNLNPLTILNRGYAIALDTQGHVLNSIKQFKTDMPFKLKLSDGEIEAKSIS